MTARGHTIASVHGYVRAAVDRSTDWHPGRA